MGRTRLDSSMIAWVDYDDAVASLLIEFTSGERYRYFMVPASVVDALVRAPSAGAFFNQHIRDAYRFTRA